MEGQGWSVQRHKAELSEHEQSAEQVQCQTLDTRGMCEVLEQLRPKDFLVKTASNLLIEEGV